MSYYRRTTRLILALMVGLALLPSLYVLVRPFLTAWLPEPPSGPVLALITGGAVILIALLVLTAIRRAVAALLGRLRLQRRPRLGLTRQSAATFHAAASTDTQAANARQIAALASQGHTVPGFAVVAGVVAPALDHKTSILVYLRGSGIVGATPTEMLESIGLAPQERDRTLRTLEAEGLITQAAGVYHITAEGEGRISYL